MAASDHVQRFDPDGRFLTGDVGRVDADGALFVEGRIDDVINRGGQKIVPTAVEAAIASMPAIRAVTAFGMPDPILGNRVAVVVELQDGADVTVDELLDHAGQRLRSFMVPELVFFADAIPRNDLGKISRHDLATIYHAGPAEPGSEDEREAALDAPDDLVAAVLDVYGHLLGRTVVDPQSSFYDLGADSLHTLYLHLELEQRFGVTIQPALFARNSSASALASYVARQQERVPLVVNEFQSGDQGETLVFSHAIDGTAWMAFGFARTELAPGRRILGLSVAGPEVLDQGPRPISELVPEYARKVRDLSPGPFVVVGHSLGAHIGAATANAFIAQRASVPVLVVIDDDAELTRRSFGAASRSPAARTVLAFFRHAVDLSPLAPYPGPVVLIRCEEDDADYRSDRTGGWGRSPSVACGTSCCPATTTRSCARTACRPWYRSSSQRSTPHVGKPRAARSRPTPCVRCAMRPVSRVRKGDWPMRSRTGARPSLRTPTNPAGSTRTSRWRCSALTRMTRRTGPWTKHSSGTRGRSRSCCASPRSGPT